MPQSTFEAGTAVKLDVIVRNLSDELDLIPKVDGHAEDYLHIEVRASDGKQLERIDRQTLSKNAKTYSFPKRGWGSRKLETIKPHDESRNYLVLSALFDLSMPGAYSVSAKADLQRPNSGPEIKWVETAAEKIQFVVKR
jgi:hypothetical protein